MAVVIANWLSYGRTNKEKVWDLRRQAYGLIISELRAVEQICDVVDEYISEVGAMHYFDGPDRKHLAQIHDHMSSIRKRFADDYLILSDGFVTLYEELIKEMTGDPNNNPPDDHDIFSAAIRKYRPLLTSLARSETATRNRWWSSLFR
ncbi:MAG: hypothetical protein ABIL01_29065 [Pseudomonadota bacterium]